MASNNFAGGSNNIDVTIPGWLWQKFHEEIEEFYAWILPTQEEAYLRLAVKNQISTVLKSKWPKLVIESYGSFKAGLCHPCSDVDLVIFGAQKDYPMEEVKILLLHANICAHDDIKLLRNAAVPIIKMRHQEYEIDVDINYQSSSGLKAADLTRKFKLLIQPLGPLVMVIKHFLWLHEYNEVFSGGFSSYSVVLMTVSFFQQIRGKTIIVPDRFKNNLGYLLVTFLLYYGEFNCRQLQISVRNGGALLPRKDDSPVISIEDPLTPDNDVSKKSFLCGEILQLFRNQGRAILDTMKFLALNKTLMDPEQILRTFVQFPEHLYQHRDRMKRKIKLPELPPPPIDLIV